jgi:tripartite ATP-independent transporter DctM subunit
MLTFTLLVLLGLILLSIPIAAALGLLGLSLSSFYSPMPLHRALGDILWQNGTEYLLVAIPMFVLLGELLLRAGVTQGMYRAMALWMNRVPGGLMHANIGSSALFAATSGSSVATAATIGTVSLPQMHERGYPAPLFLGTIAAGGTLGILIPPSINLIVYGLLTDTSVPALYLAGLIPGAILAGLFTATVIIACVINKKWAGRPVDTTWSERFGALPALLPPVGIFLVVVGSIYAGIATPTEAASLGVVAALILAATNRRLTKETLLGAFESTMRTTAMILLIILAAIFLNFILGVIGLTQALTAFISGLGLSPLETILLIVVFYLVLGCFMETMSMLLTTAPLIAPIVVSLGYDPVWFGILLMVLLETALITPPIGVNLYVVQGVRESGPFSDVMKGALLFILPMLAMIALLIALPDVALWLPGLFY